jgi:hypothetical protein
MCREANLVNTIEDIRHSVMRHVHECDNPTLLVEIDRMLVGDAQDESLLVLDEEDIRALLRELLDE